MKVLTRAKAIRAKCLDCMCGQSAEVKRCNIYTCPLWPYRMGYGPNSKKFQDEIPPEDQPKDPPENV